MKKLITTIGKRLFGIVLATAFLPIAGPAQATLIYDLQVSQIYNNFAGTGRIEFAMPTGNDPSGVSAFNFSGTGPLGNFSFTESDILNIDWSINPSNFLTLNLGTYRDQAPTTTAVGTCIILQNDGAGGTCGPNVLTTSITFSRIAQQRIGLTSTGGGNLTTSRVYEQIPEPSTIALLGLGLAGLKLGRRR